MCKWIKKLFYKNTIEIGDATNTNIYQNCTVENNPAVTVYRVKDDPEELKLTMDLISKAVAMCRTANCQRV